jgi:hypothetical protein
MNNQPVFWKMRNGKLISVDEMDINHLRNVLKMIIRNNQKVQVVQAKPKVEFKLNGDIAQDFNDSRTCPNCNEEWMSDTCCGFDACEVDIY